MRFIFSLVILAFPCITFSQAKDSVKYDFIDTIKGIKINEVTVEAFYSRVQWKAVPAAVAVVSSQDLNRYANTSLVPVFNVIPGVRMEERSPASYRLSLRGSLLRSPFGVRNVKVYWNDIPLTDAGGNTYLNLVDMNDLTSAEIIKGPAASVYGANTGGAVLLRSGLNYSAQSKDHFSAGLSGGSFGLFQQQAGWEHSGKNFSSSLQQTHAERCFKMAKQLAIAKTGIYFPPFLYGPVLPNTRWHYISAVAVESQVVKTNSRHDTRFYTTACINL
jgi:iron complex outermembrane receptor protein